jgi:hypothetical protein
MLLTVCRHNLTPRMAGTSKLDKALPMSHNQHMTSAATPNPSCHCQKIPKSSPSTRATFRHRCVRNTMRPWISVTLYLIYLSRWTDRQVDLGPNPMITSHSTIGANCRDFERECIYDSTRTMHRYVLTDTFVFAFTFDFNHQTPIENREYARSPARVCTSHCSLFDGGEMSKFSDGNAFARTYR